MTSMRMQILFCVALVDLVLVRYIGRRGGMGGGDDVHANAASVFLLLFCVLCIGGERGGAMGAFRDGFCGVFLQFPGSTVPTLDFLHMPAWTSMYVFDLRAGVGRGGRWWG